MFILRRHRHRSLRTTTKLSLARLLLSIGVASIDTVWVLYLNLFNLNSSTIGFISAFLVILTLLTGFYSIPILEKFREFKTLIISLLVMVVSYMTIALFDNLYAFLFFSAVLAVFSVLRINSFDILFRDQAKESSLNEEEGLMYSIINIGWLIGPLIAGFVMASYGIKSVFILSSIFVTLSLIFLVLVPIKVPRRKKEPLDINLRKNFQNFISNKLVHSPYLISTGIEIWWILIFIYTPLFMVRQGLNEVTVGIFVALTAVPSIFIDFYSGRLSQKFGFRKFFFYGFLLMGVLSVLSFFSVNIYLTLLFLILGSTAMAFVEPLQESFFFKRVSKNDEEKFYPIFSSAGDIGSFIGKFSVAFVLLFLPLKFSYLVIAFFMFLMSYIAFKIKDDN